QHGQQRYYSAHTNDEAATVKKTTILDIKKKFAKSIPISMVTAYDYCSAKEVDRAAIDITLVGDSLGMVVLGEKGTTNVTMDQMVHHCKAVMRGTTRAFVVGDMPFGSFETSPRDAVQNAIRLMKEGGVDAVKLEGGKKHMDKVKEIVKAGIPVMGHIGLTPQSVSAFGGFKLQGKTSIEAMNIMEDALALQEAGCFAIVIEMVPELVAANITQRLSVPTIGIGAGAGTSGQVLVYHDMLGLYSDFVTKFCKQYATLSPTINEGLKNFKKEIEERKFPLQQHSFAMKEEEANKFIQSLSVQDQQNQPAVNNTNNNSNSSTSDMGRGIVNNSENISAMLKELRQKEKEIEEAILAASKATAAVSATSAASRIAVSQASLKVEPERYQLSMHGTRRPKIVVIGAGAMGSYFSAKLAAKDFADVWMVSAWKEHVERINKNGLNLINLEGRPESIRTVRATLDALDVIKDGYPDLCLVLVKSHSTKQASITAAKMVGGNPNAIVLTLQNGVGNREEIEQTISEKGYKNKVWQGVTSNGAVMDGAGTVRHTGSGLTYLASPSLPDAPEANLEPQTLEEYRALQALGAIFNDAGISSELSYDVESLVWSKVVVNAAINPLSAVLGVPNGYLVKDDYSKNLMKKIIVEGMEVCKAKGIKLPYGEDTEEGFKYVANIAERTSANYSSMLVDVIRGQPTEVNSINGVIVKEGERLDVNVAYNKMIMEMVLKCHTSSSNRLESASIGKL
ncbi:hypothetical protein SAMD00019534_014020, partial [Acytostelium subglobosum LB1]|uniref:hypothetical protein n=1 Tax=Acytostelium subglobosum LB1 TaxID=1410327 RepID=UPI000644921C